MSFFTLRTAEDPKIKTRPTAQNEHQRFVGTQNDQTWHDLENQYQVWTICSLIPLFRLESYSCIELRCFGETETNLLVMGR